MACLWLFVVAPPAYALQLPFVSFVLCRGLASRVCTAVSGEQAESELILSGIKIVLFTLPFLLSLLSPSVLHISLVSHVCTAVGSEQTESELIMNGLEIV